jgi:hypothetical protein
VSYFNWIWRHSRFKTTAAQRANLTTVPWTWNDIVTYPIKITNQIQSPDQALKYLRQTLILSNPMIADLYFFQSEKFPLTHQYLQKLDYLKFLLIDALTDSSDR